MLIYSFLKKIKNQSHYTTIRGRVERTFMGYKGNTTNGAGSFLNGFFVGFLRFAFILRCNMVQ